MSRPLALVSIALSIMIVVLDGAMVAVALPSITETRGLAPSDAIWVVTAYQIAVVSTLLPLAALGEAIGFRRVHLCGVAVFGVAAALCAVAPSFEVLVGLRIMQGLGGAAVMSINVAMVRHIMPPGQLARGIGLASLVVGLSAASGPWLGAVLVTLASPNAVFWAHVPVSAIAFALGLAVLPPHHGSKLALDGHSVVLNIIAFGLFVHGLASATRPEFLALAQVEIAGGLLAFALLVRRQHFRPRPIFPVDLLARPGFAYAVGASTSSFVAQFMALICLPFFLSDKFGLTAMETGLLLTPWPVAIAMISPLAGRVRTASVSKVMRAAGMVLFALGMIILALIPARAPWYFLVAPLILSGVGVALFHPSNVALMMLNAPASRSGGASGMQSTARLSGQSVGAALASGLLGLSASLRYETIFLVAGVFAILAGVLSLPRAAWKASLEDTT